MREFEYEKKNAYGIENWNNVTIDMTSIGNNEVKNAAECNLLHDIINTTKYKKNLNICMVEH